MDLFDLDVVMNIQAGDLLWSEEVVPSGNLAVAVDILTGDLLQCKEDIL